MSAEVLREVWRITERRDGAVFKTKYIEDRWVPLDGMPGRPDNDPDLMWGSKSLDFDGPTIRRISP